MATEIKSGASADLQTVDPTSKAARGTLYGVDGKLIYKRPTYEANIAVPHLVLSAAVALNSLVWALRYNGTGILRVKSACLLAGFSGTAAVTTSCYRLVRISAANTTGGTALTPVLTDTTYTPLSIDARYNYGAALGVVGVTVGNDAIGEWGAQRQLAALQQLVLNSRAPLYSSVVDLRAGEGIAIKLGIIAVIGDSLGGSLELQEYATTD